eukprot:jgi/Tetstr1/440057/TSEL_028416.t1
MALLSGERQPFSRTPKLGAYFSRPTRVYLEIHRKKVPQAARGQQAPLCSGKGRSGVEWSGVPQLSGVPDQAEVQKWPAIHVEEYV